MYAALGWKVFPVWEMDPLAGACSCEEGEECGRPGKHPRIGEGVNEASSDRSMVESWWRRWPSANIGIATGMASNLTVVDADVNDGKPGLINLTRICADHGGIPATLVCNTGGGGLHLYFNFSDTLPTGSNVLGEAIDVRNNGGYVIAPPSNHVSGNRYVWREDRAELKDVPDWLTPEAARRALGDNPRSSGGRGSGTRQRGARAPSSLRMDKVEAMLGHIDPDDRDKWLKVGLILGRLYVGTAAENEAWALYEAWAARSDKFDEDRSGNIERMREMFANESQVASRTGRDALGAGTLIMWAREGGWTPWGDRVAVQYEAGNEPRMCEELVQALVESDDNRFFDVMGEIRDVIRCVEPSVRALQRAAEHGLNQPEVLVVRKSSAPSMQHALAEVSVLASADRHGNPTAKPIPEGLALMILRSRTHDFPVLSGIAEWPMVGMNGEVLVKARGYDDVTGLYFDIDPELRIDDRMTAKSGWKFLKEELFADFPFESPTHQAGALAMMLCMMQRPLMKTCPAFSVTAPQPGTGKSTLIECSALAVLGRPVDPHAFSHDDEELRKAIHSLLISKTPVVMFDNIRKGSAISNDHLSKLITSEVSSDRVLGSSETRREYNTLLVTFTGNNITFIRDMASRVVSISLNARVADPLRRRFKHPDIRVFSALNRNKILSALIAIAKLADNERPIGLASRFEDFDLMIVRPVMRLLSIDIRDLNVSSEVDDEDTMEGRELLRVLNNWQCNWRNARNSTEWTTAEVVNAIHDRVFPDSDAAIIKRSVGNPKNWENNSSRALGYSLRAIKGDHKFTPYVLNSRASSSGAMWMVQLIGREATVSDGGIAADPEAF